MTRLLPAQDGGVSASIASMNVAIAHPGLRPPRCRPPAWTLRNPRLHMTVVTTRLPASSPAGLEVAGDDGE